jgi:hypothetical protein
VSNTSKLKAEICALRDEIKELREQLGRDQHHHYCGCHGVHWCHWNYYTSTAGTSLASPVTWGVSSGTTGTYMTAINGINPTSS